MKKAVFLLLCVIFCLSGCSGGASVRLSSPSWEKAYDLDSFGDATEHYYLGLTQRASGSYKSSSVTDGALEAELRVDANRIRILLFENGSDQVRNGEHSAIAYTVLMKAADGSKTQLYGRMASGGDCVEIWEDQARSILHFADAAPEGNPVAKALCVGDGEVSFYLTREDQPATSYLFTVKTGNFAALYEAEIVQPIQEKQEELRSLRIESMKPIAAGDAHTVGLKADGSVVTVGWNYYGQRDVSGWSDIVAVAAGDFHTVGLKADGTVVAAGSNVYGSCEISDWSDIVAAAASAYHTVGLKADGSVVAAGRNDDG